MTAGFLFCKIKEDFMFVSESMYELGSKRSAIRELFEYGKKRAAIVGAENVYDFSLGNPTVPAPDCVNETIRELTQSLDSISLHGYTSAQGDLETRQAIADYLNNTYETNFKADNLYMTMGAAASLSIAFKALTSSPDDEIIAIAPFFPEYRVFVTAAGAKFNVVAPDTKNFQINFDEFEKLVNKNTKAVIINSPNNPSGAVYSEQTIKKLADFLSKKSEEYGTHIFIITDEPYREIVYDGVEVPYVTKYYNDTIVCYSYSKSLSLPGERIGYLVIPSEASDSEDLISAASVATRILGFVNAPTLQQKVVKACLNAKTDISYYDRNREALYNGLKELGFECVRPEGAFYLFVKSPVEDEKAFCAAAKKYNILIVPGSSFGCPGYVRIAYCVAYETIVNSLPKFKELAGEYK